MAPLHAVRDADGAVVVQAARRVRRASRICRGERQRPHEGLGPGRQHARLQARDGHSHHVPRTPLGRLTAAGWAGAGEAVQCVVVGVDNQRLQDTARRRPQSCAGRGPARDEGGGHPPPGEHGGVEPAARHRQRCGSAGGGGPPGGGSVVEDRRAAKAQRGDFAEIRDAADEGDGRLPLQRQLRAGGGSVEQADAGDPGPVGRRDVAPLIPQVDRRRRQRGAGRGRAEGEARIDGRGLESDSKGGRRAGEDGKGVRLRRHGAGTVGGGDQLARGEGEADDGRVGGAGAEDEAHAAAAGKADGVDPEVREAGHAVGRPNGAGAAQCDLGGGQVRSDTVREVGAGGPAAAGQPPHGADEGLHGERLADASDGRRGEELEGAVEDIEGVADYVVSADGAGAGPKAEAQRETATGRGDSEVGKSGEAVDDSGKGASEKETTLGIVLDDNGDESEVGMRVGNVQDRLKVERFGGNQ